MTTTQDYAVLSLYVYRVTSGTENFNRPQLPADWEELQLSTDNLLGFSYGVFRSPSGEIVVAYTGTNEIVGDWVNNLLAAGGLGSPQATAAALVYLTARDQYGPNITLTGHSLGGGLASVMSVWFDRPAVVFDHAPFEFSARNPLLVLATKAALALTGRDLGAFLGYNELLNFAIREQNVSGNHLSGEALEYLRLALPTIGISQALEVGSGLSAVQLHSMALYSVAKFSPAFVQATLASEQILPLLMDTKLYAANTATSTERNFLLDLIRSEQTTPGDSKLDNFSEDLQKLGTNLAGLNANAQKAIIAQGVEWYYWQSTDYAGQNFFIDNGQAGLLQYTSAVGAALPGAMDKAATYVGKWLTPIYNANGAFGGRNSFDQWSVAISSAAIAATARDATKTQIYIGQGGADNFTGGDKADTLIAGDGNDTLKGGAGVDLLYGGAGDDRYEFNEAFGSDKVVDSDATGSLWVDNTRLDGGKLFRADVPNVWESADNVYRYSVLNGNLVIGKGSKANASQMQGTITVQNWTGTGLGIELSSTVMAQDPIDHTYTGDFIAKIVPGGAEVTRLGRNGELVVVVATGAARFVSDAQGNLVKDPGGVLVTDNTIFGSAERDDIDGGVGNDALSGQAGDDFIQGGVGDDLIGGGAGHDYIEGGAGADIIFSGRDVRSELQQAGPSDHVWPQWGQAANTTLVSEGATWGSSLTSTGVLLYGDSGAFAGATSADGDIVLAGAGNDFVVGSYGDDFIDGGIDNDLIAGSGGTDVIDGSDGSVTFHDIDFLHGEAVENIKSQLVLSICLNMNSKQRPFQGTQSAIYFKRKRGNSSHTQNGFFCPKLNQYSKRVSNHYFERAICADCSQTRMCRSGVGA